MSKYIDAIRRLLYRVPRDGAKRSQVVREEILRKVNVEEWQWKQVEASAKAAHADLKKGHLPESNDEIQIYIRSICEEYKSKGYPIEDLRDAVDGVQARASANQSIDQSE